MLEKTKKNYTTREWALLISSARRNPKPYEVFVLDYSEFFDFTDLFNKLVKNISLNTNNEKVKWLLIKWLRFEKCKPNIFQYKYNLSDETFQEIDTTFKQRKSRSLNPNLNHWLIPLQQKFSAPNPISYLKKMDLLELLNKNVIPQDYRNYIEQLPSTLRPIRRIHEETTDSDAERE